VAVKQMYQNLKESVAGLCKYEAKKGGKLHIGFEPKPNEGHPAMLIPTVASAIVFWRKVAEEFGVSLKNKGVNKEFGHSEMIGLDHVYDTVEELDNDMMVHMHLNSQGYNDGIILGGPGKYDIDHGARINGMNIAIAGLIQQAGYDRWKGHDMQPRAYDNTEQAINRVVRSVLSWEACEKAAKELKARELLKVLAQRDTAAAEDMMRAAVVNDGFGGGEGLALYLRYPKAQLPWLYEWKMMGEGTYVVGVEPANSLGYGRARERAEDRLPFLAPGASVRYELEIGATSGKAEIARIAGG
jgi:xylose isomerase